MGYIFAFNFNPSESFPDYGFSAPSGKYQTVFNSDEPRFNGPGRLSDDKEHFTFPTHCPSGDADCKSTLQLYLPCRCVIVLKKTE